MMAYELGEIAMHSRIFVRLTSRTHVVPDEKAGASIPIEEVSKKHLEEHRKRLNADYVAKEEKKPKKLSSHIILTTVGRCIFNDILPQGDAVLQLRADRQGQQPRDRRHVRSARSSRDDRSARRHEDARLPPEHARGLVASASPTSARPTASRAFSMKARRRPTRSRSSTTRAPSPRRNVTAR